MCLLSQQKLKCWSIVVLVSDPCTDTYESARLVVIELRRMMPGSFPISDHFHDESLTSSSALRRQRPCNGALGRRRVGYQGVG